MHKDYSMYKNYEVSLEEGLAHGLSEEEFIKICNYLSRKPKIVELGIFSVMWSEHCSYKTSRIHLNKFPTTGEHVLIGPGENAGAVDIGGGYAAIFKMESHNHPSFIEPFEGAATGLGGILRDVFTMGARPIANLNSLRFGDIHHSKTPYLLNGVVGGIGHYGNSIGIPTVGGEVYFDPSYDGNILVNVFTLGVSKIDKIAKGIAKGIGNLVYYMGSGTGRDGIHGATMASENFEAGEEGKRPTVQVGDPFRGKLVMECTLELIEKGWVVGIQDMGAAGLTSSAVEMANRAGNGIRLDLDHVPQREENMNAYEILLSESQERMLFVVEPKNSHEVQKIVEKWELEWAVIGEVIAEENFEIWHRGKQQCEIPIEILSKGIPVYDRPIEKYMHLKVSEEILAPKDLSNFFLEFIGSPNLCSRRDIFSQYDFSVGMRTMIGPGNADAAILKTPQGASNIAVAVDCSSRKVFLNAHEGAKHTVAESTRNLSCVGALVVGITDCLNFGDPTKPKIMGQFVDAIEGISEACRVLKAPIVSGNVSLYNASSGQDIYPTPTIASVGILDSKPSVTMRVKTVGHKIALLGRKTRIRDLGASEYLWIRNGEVGNDLPKIDLEEEYRLQACIRELIREGSIVSAHDCSEGGLGVAIFEKLEGTGKGVRLNIKNIIRKDLYLFSETPTRILVSFSGEIEEKIEQRCLTQCLFFDLIGEITNERILEWEEFRVDLEQAEKNWKQGLGHLI